MAAGGRPGGWFRLLNFGGVTKAPTIRHTYIINLLVDDDDVILANAKKVVQKTTIKTGWAGRFEKKQQQFEEQLLK